MKNDRKLNVLRKIARRLNEAGITWAVGGSMLLYFKGIAAEFNDIDILVLHEEADAVQEILLRMGTLEPSEPKAQYRTKTFLEFTVDGVDVDVMAGFAIVKDGKEYDCSLKKEQIAEHIMLGNDSIPLQAVALWRRYYELMGKTDKVQRIDTMTE